MHQRARPGGWEARCSRSAEKETAGDEPSWIYRYPIRGSSRCRRRRRPRCLLYLFVTRLRLLDCLKSGWKPVLTHGWTLVRISASRNGGRGEEDERGRPLPRWFHQGCSIWHTGCQDGVSHLIWRWASVRTNSHDLIPTLMLRQATVTTHFAPTYKPKRDPCSLSHDLWTF